MTKFKEKFINLSEFMLAQSFALLLLVIMIYNKLLGKNYCIYNDKLHKILLTNNNILSRCFVKISKKLTGREYVAESHSIIGGLELLNGYTLTIKSTEIKILRGNYKTVRTLYK